MNLAGFIDTYKDAIAQRVVESYPPLYRPSDAGSVPLPKLLRSPLGAQADAIRGAALSLRANQGTTVVGEMGTGKTFIATAAAHAAGFERILVLAPPHLTIKWKREIEQTIPGAKAVIVSSITDLDNLRRVVAFGPLFAIMSRERAKLSYRWKPSVVNRWAVSGGRLMRMEETGQPFRIPTCPVCARSSLTQTACRSRKRSSPAASGRAPSAGSALWQADNSGPRRYPLADYVKNHMPGFFDLLIGDEVHEYKGRGSAQGIAAGVLADACGRSLTLTGTLLGGYSSTLFHLLYRFSPDIRSEFGRSEEGRWINRYGFVEHSIGKDDGHSVEDGRNSRRRKYRKTVKERPGLAPSALFHLIGNSVFLRLSDVASGLPDYDEQVMLTAMDSDADATGFSQKSAYEKLFEKLRHAMVKALADGSRRLLSTYLQSLLAYPDGCTRGETVFDPASGEPLIQVPPLAEDRVYPKEKALLDLVAAERLGGSARPGLRDAHGNARHHRPHGRHANAARVQGGRDEGGLGGPGAPRGVGGGEGQAGGGRHHLPPAPRTDRPRPRGLPDHRLVRDGLLRLHHAAGVPALLADRPDPPSEGHLHGLQEHPPSRRAQAGGQEAPVVAGGGGRTPRRRPGRLRRRWR